ncbi:hypothetical protein [Tumebacillus flagellatus]|uniref:Uncharacterized protein n=1 Tax=Tumebacillus flagellatus TaxID=1157490 RepID=A0A074LMA8_9BACL|nr:hypothetical protein [Tumebacillus flagellatus]KEO81018.1 hypothetical protein EL26_23040 [Tumebacillus flagellatus]
MKPRGFSTTAAKLFFWYASLHYSYVWLLNFNPHQVEYPGFGGVYLYLILKNAVWLGVLALLAVRSDPERKTLVIRGLVPRGHLMLLFVTGMLLLLISFWKQPTEVFIDMIDLLGFSFATVLAEFVLRDEADLPSYTRLIRWIAWVVLGIGLYQKAIGFVGPHFGRIISTLGGPELLSLFSIFLLGQFLWQLRHPTKGMDVVWSLAGIVWVGLIQLYTVTVAGQVAMVVYLLVCAAVLGGRALWLAGLGLTGLMIAAWQSELFQETLYKLQKLSGDTADIGRLAEHRMFWDFFVKKSTWIEWLFGAEHGLMKFENQFYFLAYNYGVPVLVAFLLLLWNALLAGWRAWRAVSVQGERKHADLAFVNLAYFVIVLLVSNITPYLTSFPVNVFAWFGLGAALQVRTWKRPGRDRGESACGW